MKQRTITAIFFALAMIGGIYGGYRAFQALCVLIAGGCLWELSGLLLPAGPGKSARQALAVALGLSVVAGSMFGGDPAGYGLLFPVLIFSLFLIELFANPEKPFSNVAHILLGIFYVGLPMILLHRIATTGPAPYAPHRVFGLLWLVWTNDTLAYLIGSHIGRTKLFPRISPNKTWEGSLGGALGTVGMAWGLSFFVPDFTVAQWLALGLVVGVFGTLGDLVESMLKRSVGVKDSGSLLPGHGGLLDRFDAFLFVLPFAWLALALLATTSFVIP